MVACSAVLVSTTLLALRHFIGIAFSNEEEVINYVTRMVPVLSISVITDSLQGVLSGTHVFGTSIFSKHHKLN
jgi:MATE family multidrug resistance protein